MFLLEISVAAVSANAPAIIITSAVLSVVVAVILAIDEIHRHNLARVSDCDVHEASWNNDKDGISADGVPYYGSGK